MGYACPVCDTPQQDAEHLANHLAFTAMLGNDEHATWLDEHTPGWDEQGPDELAPRVTDHAEETEYEQVFEDTVHQHGHDHDALFEEELGQEADQSVDLQDAQQRGSGNLDPEAQQIMNEAQEMTREMLDADDEDAQGASAEQGDEEKES